MSVVKNLQRRRQRRVLRVRNQVKRSDSGRMRLSVFRSNKHIYTQVIDDSSGLTLVSASTSECAFRAEFANGGNTSAARGIGKVVAARCIAKGISEVVFDRGSYKYHGRVAALADGAREVGLIF